MQSTQKNLTQYGAAPLAQWLIDAAKRRSSITYGEAKKRLETECGFEPIFSAMMGRPAGALMDRILEIQPDCPLLNILLVQQGDGLPGEGAGMYMDNYLGQSKFADRGYRDSHKQQWRDACNKLATDVYAFRDWERVFKDTFGGQLAATTPSKGSERDGIGYTRAGEGPNHRALRLWVMENPDRIHRTYTNFETDTEVVLESADRVDVVYYGSRSTIAIEVKSLDSDDTDLRRGVFQCIKYRAVMEAMDIRSNAHVVPILVTQTPLSGDLDALARRHGVRHIMAPETFS